MPAVRTKLSLAFENRRSLPSSHVTRGIEDSLVSGSVRQHQLTSSAHNHNVRFIADRDMGILARPLVLSYILETRTRSFVKSLHFLQ
jgi:hypothetical protein